MYEDDYVTRAELLGLLHELVDEVKATAAERDRYLSVPELCEYLGSDRSTVNKWLDDGVWPYLQPGGAHGRRKVRLSEVVKTERRGLLS